jgi:aspartate-semialdehyde dehydrogenase
MGGAVLQLLEEREFPVGRLYPLTLREADASVVFRGQDWPCEAAQTFDFGQVQALLVASPGAAALRLVEQVRARRPTLPVVTLDDIDPAPALAVARILQSLAALGDGLDGADAFVALPVAMNGQAGVEELATQSRGLFNMESPEPEVFPLQIAFNLLPHEGEGDVGAYECRLSRTAAQRVPGLDVAFSVAWAPVFFGAAIHLHARTASPVTAEALRGALARRDGVLLMEADLPAATPTPATDAQGSDSVFVGRIRIEGRMARLWLVFDPVQLEAAQLVDRVENWIAQPANSMLT